MPTTVSGRLRLATEGSLLVVHVAVLAGLIRLFADWSFFRQLLGVVVVAHLLAALLRRLDRGAALSTLVMIGGGLVTISSIFYPSSTTIGVPSTETWQLFRADLDVAWTLFQEVQAPADPSQPFLVVTAIALWAVVLLADWAAFRLRSPVEAMVPGTVLFVFGALFAAEDYRVAATVGFVGSVLLFALVQRTANNHATLSWLGGSTTRGVSTVLQGGAVLGAIAVLGGVVLAPTVLGADNEGLVDVSDVGGGGGARVVLSPLVSIQSQIVDLADVEVFTVETDRPDYWRLTSLDQFDGSVWQSSGRFESASGPLPSDLPEATLQNTDISEQTFRIQNLGSIWLPAAYEPSAITDDGGANAKYESASGTLTVDNTIPDVDGFTYVVQSRIPRRDLAAIQGAAGPVPPAIAERYLGLPDDFSAEARALADQIVADASATTPYEQALALQQFFREGFAYDLAIESGHGIDSINEFLFDVRAGYCEQFSSAFAAMARHLGLPSRVAVGFTPGIRDGDVYRVRGEHAHAWPEVYLTGIGWLRFEPTPGRGAPGDQVYTGQPAQQAQTGRPDEAVDLGGEETPAEPPPTPTIPTPDLPDAGVPDLPPDLDGIPDEGGSTVVADSGSSTGWLLALPVLVVALLALIGVGIWAAKRRVQHARRRSSTAPDWLAGVLWDETMAALSLIDVRRLPQETPLEFAGRAHDQLEAGDDLRLLAEVATEARYSPALATDRFDSARQASDVVITEVRQRTTPMRRLRAAIDPRPLWRSRNATP